MAKMAKTVILLAVIAALTGCATLSPGEIAYQTVHAVDVAQTVEIARNPARFKEVGMGTDALLGEHPSEAGAIEWGVANSILHFAIDDYLYRSNHPKLALFFESASIAIVADTVHNNYKIGLGYGFR